MKTLLGIVMLAILCTDSAPEFNGSSSAMNNTNITLATPETTILETTIPETTILETTIPETTIPENTIPENTTLETAMPKTTTPETTTPETTTPLGAKLLRCHVCRGSFQCFAPQYCAPNEKFCMIAETGEGSTVIKYCSITCPLIDKFYGRTSTDWYIACCANDLCNYKKLANGHRLCANFLVVAMAFMASFLGTLRIGL